MQTVSGFTIGCSYSINFFQAVVKQFQVDYLDTAGSWAVYIDNNLLGISSPTVSYEPYASTSFVWEYRSFTFTASAISHTIKFLPADDDTNQTDPNPLVRLRMGIDSIYIKSGIGSNFLGNDDTILCQGETLTLGVTLPNATYVWQDNSTSPTFIVTQQGTYWVQVTDGCGSTTDTINVSYNSFPIVDLGNDTTLCQGESLTLDATIPNVTYLWQDNSTNPTFTVTQQGTYWVEVTVNNCSTTDTIRIDLCETSITIGPSFAYIPNVFNTASNNPENEKLFVFGKNIRSFKLSIYDRWGEIIYETNDSSKKLRSDGACCAYGEGWDGTFRNTGKPLNEAVFVFILNGEFTDGRQFNESGNITLIK